MARSLFYTIVIAIVFCALSVHSQFDDEFDATSRDRTEKCKVTWKYAPVDEQCENFDTCCEQELDPLNGDKCQFKQSSCEILEGQTRPTAQCKLLNCTELITTTTTTTTSRPVFESINSGISAFTVASLLVSFVYQIVIV